MAMSSFCEHQMNAVSIEYAESAAVVRKNMQELLLIGVLYSNHPTSAWLDAHATAAVCGLLSNEQADSEEALT